MNMDRRAVMRREIERKAAYAKSELIRQLTELDVEAFRVTSATKGDDFAVLAIMHKMRERMPQISLEKKQQSREWLRKQGYTK